MYYINVIYGIKGLKISRLLRYARNDGHCEERSDEAIQRSRIVKKDYMNFLTTASSKEANLERIYL